MKANYENLKERHMRPSRMLLLIHAGEAKPGAVVATAFVSVLRFMARFTANSSPTAIMVAEATANGRQQMAFDIFLKIDGIKGESSDNQHREEIEPASFSWGAGQQGTTSAGGGAGAGKTTFHDLHVVMDVSQASPQLFLACAEGRHITTAVLTCRRAGGREQREFLRFTLSDVLVSSYQTNSQAEDSAPVDQVSFKYAQIKIEYWPQKADGSLGAPVTAGWNLKTNNQLK